MNCPCGSEKTFAECCEPIIKGERLAATPEELMELTGLVRRYIERTTGIHAPEQTTRHFTRLHRLLAADTTHARALTLHEMIFPATSFQRAVAATAADRKNMATAIPVIMKIVGR